MKLGRTHMNWIENYVSQVFCCLQGIVPSGVRCSDSGHYCGHCSVCGWHHQCHSEHGAWVERLRVPGQGNKHLIFEHIVLGCSTLEVFKHKSAQNGKQLLANLGQPGISRIYLVLDASTMITSFCITHRKSRICGWNGGSRPWNSCASRTRIW